MDKKKRKWVVRIAIVVAALMILTTIVPVFTTIFAGALTQSDIDKMKNELSSLSSNKKDLQNELKSLEKKQENEMERKNVIDKNITVTESEIVILTNLIEELALDLEQKNRDLERAEENVEGQYALLTERIRVTYEAGNISYVELLLSSRSYSEFLINMDIVSNIVEFDQKILEDLRQIVLEIDEAKRMVEEAKAEQENAKAELETKRAELKERLKESEALIKALEADAIAFEKELKKAEEEEKEVQRQIAAAIASMSSTEFVGGEFIWPCPVYSYISCYFGPRIHPVTGKPSNHSGMDIASGYGNKIIATNAGTVIKAVSGHSVYGNYVVISHGGGYSSLYGHMSKLGTSEGATVAQGQVIGYVGSTGLSTGNHLHFEISKNGVLQDPMNYVKAPK